MAVRKLAVIHSHATLSSAETIHAIVVQAIAYGCIIIRCEAVGAALAIHKHSAERQLVLLRGVERHAGTCEEIVAPVVVVGTIVLIIGGRSLMALGTSRIGAVAIADVGISVDERTAVVDVKAGVGTASGVAASLQRTIIARLTVFLEHDVDDAHRSFSGELCRRIVNDLNAVDTLRGELLQNLRTVVGGQTRSLAVYPYLHTGVATQRHVAVVVHLHGGHVVEHVRRRLSCIADKLRHVESLAIHLQLHRRLLSGDCHTL